MVHTPWPTDAAVAPDRLHRTVPSTSCRHPSYGRAAFPARMMTTTECIDPDCLVMIDGVVYRGTPD